MADPVHPPALPIQLHLVAVYSARNIVRRQSIEAASDLLGHWIVSLRWGRIGTGGQIHSLSFGPTQNAAQFVRTAPARRNSSKRRIGVGYRFLKCYDFSSNGMNFEQVAAGLRFLKCYD